jgi:hypothetical protein
MRHTIMLFAFATLSACAVSGEPSTSDPTNQSEVEQGVCSDSWECWCNTFSTQAACTQAVSGGRHCYWAGAALAATSQASQASLSQCHATYE